MGAAGRCRSWRLTALGACLAEGQGPIITAPRASLRRLVAIPLCVALVLLVIMSAASQARSSVASGSSCAHPWQATYQTGGPNGGFEGDERHIHIDGTPRLLNWSVRAGYVICNVHIQLANGRSAAPTTIYPYTTPTPLGGEYRAPHGPHSPLRTAVITAARSAVAPGASCNYPVFSSQSVDGFPSDGSDTTDYSVKVKVVRDPNPGSAEPMRLRLEVAVHNPRAVICRAFLTIFPLNPEGFIRDETAEAHPVTISPSGVVTSTDVEVPSDDGYAGVAYARLR